MPHEHASVPRLTTPDLLPAAGSGLLAAYLGYLQATGRGNSAYTQAAKTFFRRWPHPQMWAHQPLEARLAAGNATRPIITYLMLHAGLRPGYDYLLQRKCASIWREIRTCP